MQVQGFSAAAVAAGIKYANRPDLGLIVSQVPAVAAGVFTTNRVKAAPVLLDQERMRSGQAQAILVNSGNANACTGAPGMESARACADLVAEGLRIAPELIQVASTGVIGQPLPLPPFVQAMPQLIADLRPDGLEAVARAMMTTDTVMKIASRTVQINGVPVQIAAMAKGSGMIRPDMATMLCFILSDACVEAKSLDRLLHQAVDESFNTITVDGDTSTNDTVLILANGLAGNDCICPEQPGAWQIFQQALTDLCQDLAMQIVTDGEGATKLVHIKVCGTRTVAEAKSAAMTIAESPLCKTAFFGEDANWGRIIAALGRSACGFQQHQVAIRFDQVLLVENGLYCGPEAEAKATAVLKQRRFTVTVELQEGPASATAHTCDFSLDYVKINADYRS